MRKTRALVLATLLLGARYASAANTVVTLSFDDTFGDQHQAGAMLAAKGLHGVFFVNNSRLGQNTYMTPDQVMELQMAGHEIGGHTINHTSLANVPIDEAKRQICNDRAGLLMRGFNVTTFAYPLGAEDASMEPLVTDCGYNAARDVASLRSHGPESCTNCAYAETMPPLNPWAIRTPVSVKSTVTLADLQLNVTDAESHGGGWVPFVFHHVCDGCNQNAISPAVLQQFIDWLAARSAMGTSVKTFQDVIGGPLNGPVLGPDATPYVAADLNQLQNGGLENDTKGKMIPDCWNVSGANSETAGFTVTPATSMHGGAHAITISVNAGVTASPRIASVQDLGSCAPPMKPGEKFKVSAWYQATDGVRLVAYYRNTNGFWKYYAQSGALAASADWKLAEWTTPGAPSDATGFSLGVAADGKGTISVDDLFAANTAGPPAPPMMTDPGTDPNGGADMGGTDPGDGGTGGDEGGGCSMSPGGPGSATAACLIALLLALYVTRRRMA